MINFINLKTSKTMKSIFLSILLFFSISIVKAQETKVYKATVDTVGGVPFYIFAKPIADYTEVGKAVSALEIIKIMVDEESTIAKKAQDMVIRTKNRLEEGKISDFDAIIVDVDAEKTRVIKFKEEPSREAMVSIIKDIPVFFMSVPNDEYTEVGEMDNSMSMRANNGMLLDKVIYIVKRAKKKLENKEVDSFDALIVDSKTLETTLIRFK